jgi:hypothetical protein
MNGDLGAAGPAKPRPGEWFVDDLDLSAHLREGENVLAVEVLRYDPARTGNASVLRTPFAGLFVSGRVLSGGVETDLSGPRGWRCRHAPEHVIEQGVYTVFLGIQERAHGDRALQGWKQSGYDDSDWSPATEVDTGFADTRLEPWPTAPRPTPLLTLEPRGLTAGEHSEEWAFLRATGATEIPPFTTVSVDIDAGELMTAYLDLRLTSGAGAVVTLLCAEGYERPPIDAPWLRRKGDRTDSVGGDLYGDLDRYEVAGGGMAGSEEQFSPFWFRTFRYIRLSIATAHEPLVLTGLNVLQTRYPLEITGSFASSDPVHVDLWDVSVRTLRSCMHDTYEDCPYYEQLQYAMDTRSQALYTLALSSDDRLIRRAIDDFRSSATPSGLLASRFPSVVPQVIPGFSLFWILMVHEHYLHSGDLEFMRLQLGTIDTVLDSFLRRLGPQRLVEASEGSEAWDFLDWTDEWRRTKGVPDAGESGTLVVYSLMLAAALRRSAQLNSAVGRRDRAEQMVDAAESIGAAVLKTAWDGDRGLVADCAGGTAASQHAQVWAVLSATVTGSEATLLLSRMLDAPDLALCSYATSLDLFDALSIAGLTEAIDLSPWRLMLDQNLTTWAEDTVSQRSDCHAWGSVPIHHFHRNVLGVRSTDVGWRSVTVDPSLGDLTWAEGVVPTPYGAIRVRCTREADGRVNVDVSAPATIAVTVRSSADELAATGPHPAL